MRQTLRKDRASTLAACGLGALLLWQALALGRYVVGETRPPAWDQANHLEVALKYSRWAKAGAFGEIWRYAPNGTMPPFPPLYHLALACVYPFSQSPAAFLWVNWLYLALLCVSVYGLARRVVDPGRALAAAALLACTPLVQSLLRTQLVDLAVMAAVAASYWCLLRANGFKDRAWSAVFGLSCAFGILHKWSFFTFLLPAAAVWVRALGDRRARRNALLAAGLGFALGLPWYLIRLPLVVVRLTQASSDFVVPFWRGAAFFSYLGSMRSELGLPLLALAAWGAWRQRGDQRSAARLLGWWAATSYLFWALIPNRQLRFLGPGLAGLAALAAAAPRAAIWAVAAFYMASSALQPERAVRADWKLDAVLGEITSRAGRGLQPVAVIADAERFNKLSFTWRADLLGLSELRFRGVNDVPWELSPWVVTKTGSLGPAAVTAPFLPAQAAIAEQDGWFSRAFEEAGRWPLPDGSEAVLYGRRRLEAPPLRGRATRALSFSSMLEIPQADVRLGPWDRQAGVYRRATVSAPFVLVQGLEVSDARLELADAVIVPDGDAARLVSAGAVRVASATVTADALRRRLERGPVRVIALGLDGAARAALSVKGLPVSAEVAVTPGCSAALRWAAVGGVPLPAGFVERYLLNGQPLALESAADRTTVRTVFGLWRDVPFPVAVAGCSVSGGRLSIP